MLIALRDFSVKEHVVKAGDPITAETQALLPPGRVNALKAVRFVEEIPTSGDEHMDSMLAEYEQVKAYLTAGIEDMAARVAELEALSAAPINKVEVV